jgi:hypothetical protein
MGCASSQTTHSAESATQNTSAKRQRLPKNMLLGNTTAVSTNKQKEPYDLTKLWGWDPARVWVCDIKELPGETDNDFLFMADIQATGTGKDLKTQDAMTADRCIFQDVMYDIQKFTPDTSADGKLDFDIAFGNNTAERRDAPNGWTVQFESLVPIAKGRFKGTILTSWWGRRDVILINYPQLTKKEQQTYPDMMTHHYYKSR